MNEKEFIYYYITASDEVKNQILALIENRPQPESQEWPASISHIT